MTASLVPREDEKPAGSADDAQILQIVEPGKENDEHDQKKSMNGFLVSVAGGLMTAFSTARVLAYL